MNTQFEEFEEQVLVDMPLADFRNILAECSESNLVKKMEEILNVAEPDISGGRQT